MSDPQQLQVNVYQLNGIPVVIVCAKGTITRTDRPSMFNLFNQCHDEGAQRVLLDLGQVEFIDWDGAALLVLFAELLEADDKHMAVARPQGIVRYVLNELKMGTRFPVFHDYPDHLNW